VHYCKSVKVFYEMSECLSYKKKERNRRSRWRFADSRISMNEEKKIIRMN
jgi:hypothetical protein